MPGVKGDDLRLRRSSQLHFVGVKGVAMSGLALIARQMGKEVRGSDVPAEFGTDAALRSAGVKIFFGFSAEHLAWQPDVVVAGASWPDDHPEISAARQRDIPVLPESEFRGWISRQRKTIAVCGVHGKSTTTALLAWVLTQAGLDPSYLVGAPAVTGLPGNGHWGDGEYFVVEGDEYAKSQSDKTAKFLDLDPWVSVVTTLEWEHVDVYPDVAAMEMAFAALAQKTKHLVIACADWPSVVNATAGAKRRVTYGVSPAADFRLSDFQLTDAGSTFAVHQGRGELCRLSSPLIGRHNALNAIAALLAAREVGIDVPTFAQALASFRGLARRQSVTEHDGVTWIDDYGHHPTEVARTLEAIRERYPRAKIWAVFQPHLASRTRALMGQFARSFAPVNRVLVAELFASAREPHDAKAAEDLAAAIGKYHEAVRSSGSLAETAAALKPYVRPGDVVVTMGAGDVYQVRELVMNQESRIKN